MKKWFKEKYFSDSADIRMKLCSMILLLGSCGLMANALSVLLIIDQSINFYIMPIIGSVLLFIAFLLSNRFRYHKNIFFIFLILTNLVMLPYSFVTSGGTDSGNPIWLLMGIVLVFILLNGWRQWLLFALSSITDALLFYVGAKRPDLIVHMDSEVQVRQDTAICLIINGVLLGLIFSYMNHLYLNERKVADLRAKEIKELSDSKTLFFANMSHEIRTPINTIIGLNEMTLRENISDEVAENAMNIQSASRLLLSLINDILDISKMESGKMEIVPTQYETSAMLSDLVNMIWIRAEQKKLSFKLDVDEDIPSMLYGDEGRIKQILTNILTNAVKYTEKGYVMLSVKSEPIDQNRIKLKMAVSDTGIGIRKENLDDLFTVFKRVDYEKTGKIEGTGLGLAIVKQLLDLMGGTITVDSIYQKGSTFTVTIEQKIVDEKPIGSVQYLIKKDARERKIYKQSFEAPNASVLIVDDNEMNLMVAKKLLRETKIKVDTASSGRECLEKTREKFYNIILMDHMMPEMDGETTLKNLRSREDGYCQKSPVIALTANVMSGASDWYYSKGFDGYLAKPINAALLEAVIRKYLPDELIESDDSSGESVSSDIMRSFVFHEKKKKICISADCLCDLSADLVEKFDIKLMHYYVTTENGRFTDLKEISPEELLNFISTGKGAVSSCAPAKEYESHFSDCLMEADHVIHIATASGVGKGYATAVQAAEGFGNVTIIDSGQLSSGIGILALAAAELAQQDADADFICRYVEALRERVETTFIMPDAENMYRNGRVNKRIRNLCRNFSIHPILKLERNKIVFSGFKLGRMERAYKQYVAFALKRIKRIDKRVLFITYAGCNVKELEMINKEVGKYGEFEAIIQEKASSAITCNCGKNCVGLVYVKK